MQQALSLNQQGQFADATTICLKILESIPHHIDAHLLLAGIAGSRGDIEKAILLYASVIDLDSNSATAYYKKGNLLKDCGELKSALADYDQAIALDSRYAKAFCNRGVVLTRLCRWDAALESYDRAIALDPTDALAWFNRGAVLRELKQPHQALISYEQAIAVKPDYLECHYNRGLLLAELKQWHLALTSLDAAIAIKPDFAEAYCSRGNVLMELKKDKDALENFDRAIALKPAYSDAYYNRATILLFTKELAAAMASFERAIDLEPTHIEALIGRGLCLQNQRRFARAIASYNMALKLAPDRRYIFGMRRHIQMQVCDWGNLESDLERLAEERGAHRPISTPHAMLALIDSPPLHRLVAEAWVREECPPDHALGAIPVRQRSDKIRVGYFSADFRDHAVALLATGVFEAHDRSKFEITGFGFGPKTGDAIRARVEKSFDRFIDVSHLSDVEVASTARDMGIDIAVDLGGFTENARTGVFALRAAPLQINYLGYPGTMGADYMDYLISDLTVVPTAFQNHYSEKILYLPNTYLPNDSTRRIADTAYTREDLGLPCSAFVFCCFNNSYKIMPNVFEIWMRILTRTGNSVLWLSRNNPEAESNLRRRASTCGVDPTRLIFADRLLLQPEYLARLRVADLFLDTVPYNAHTTALDALWAGLPVLTRMGASYASRVAASVLKAIELPELIATSPEQYEEMAVFFAANDAQLAKIRRKLANNRLVTPLFDTALFTKNLEYAYTQIYERHLANLPPEHLYPPS